MCAIDISFGLNEPAVVCLHTCVYPWDKSIGTCLLTIPTNVFFPVFLFSFSISGMDREATYFYFLDKTAVKRVRGFQAFSLSLLLFCTSILLLSIDKLPEEFRIPACIVASGFVTFGFSEWSDITDAAQPIFTNVIPVDDDE